MKKYTCIILEFAFKFIAAIFCLAMISAPIRAMMQVHIPLNTVLLSLFIEVGLNGLVAYGFWKISEKIKKSNEIT